MPDTRRYYRRRPRTRDPLARKPRRRSDSRKDGSLPAPTPRQVQRAELVAVTVERARVQLQVLVARDHAATCERLYATTVSEEVLTDAPTLMQCRLRAEQYNLFCQGERRQEVRDALNGSPGHLCHLALVELQAASAVEAPGWTECVDIAYRAFLSGELGRQVARGEGRALDAFARLFTHVNLLGEPYSTPNFDPSNPEAPACVPQFDPHLTRELVELEFETKDTLKYNQFNPVGTYGQLRARLRRMYRVSIRLRRMLESEVIAAVASRDA